MRRARQGILIFWKTKARSQKYQSILLAMPCMDACCMLGIYLVFNLILWSSMTVLIASSKPDTSISFSVPVNLPDRK